MVTHDLHFMPWVDKIIVFKDGQIKETGDYKDLLLNTDSEFNKLSAASTASDAVDAADNEFNKLSNVIGIEGGHSEIKLSNNLQKRKL